MSTVRVGAYSSAHTVAHVTTSMLNFLKEIIRESGLDPSQLMDDWADLERAIHTWLTSRHLTRVVLEIYDSTTDVLVLPRWDLDVVYQDGADGSLWADGDAIRYHISKAGFVPSSCKYRIVLQTRDGRPDVSGFSSTMLRSTEGLQRRSIGATIGGNGIGTTTSYWTK